MFDLEALGYPPENLKDRKIPTKLRCQAILLSLQIHH